MRCNRLFCIAILLTLIITGVKAQQLSLGNTPYMVNKSAVLELNANNQGLLLTRITDTALINTLNPPDGMVIYHAPSKQFMVRSYGHWNALAAAASLTNYWNIEGNSNGVIKKFGNNDNYALPFVTNNVERMRIAADGKVGIGITAPANNLAVKDTIEIRRTTGPATLLFTNTAGAGDFRIAGDGGDVFWQGGGGRNLQMGSYWGMILSGDRQTGTLPAFSAGAGGTSVLIPSQRAASIPLAIQAAGSQTGNLTEWRNSAGAILNMMNNNGNLSIGTGTFDATNPEKLLVNAGTTTSYNLIKARGSINNYLQLNLQNTSNGTSASTDLVATADNGTETSNYVDLGINSSGYNTGFFGNANDAYLYNLGQDFLIGNGTAGKKLHFLTAGGDKITNTRMTIDSLGKVGIGTLSPTEFLDVTGNLKFSGALMPGGVAGTSGYLLQSNGTGVAPTWVTASSIVGSSAWTLDGNTLSTTKNFGTISNHALPFITNNVERMRLAANGYLGLGTANAAGRFHAVSDNSETGDDYLFDNYSNATNSGFFFRRARGTVASPLNLQNGDLIHGLSFIPRYNGSLSYAPGSAIDAYYLGSGSDNKTNLRFITSGIEQMRISEDGNIGIGETAFDAISPEKLIVNAGTGTYTPILAKGDINSYMQINIKNTSTGNQSSSDLVATANNGTETTNFVNLGINGSGYVYQTGNPIETGKFNDGYLISSGNDLYIVNNNATKDIIFLAGGTAPTNEAMRITPAEKIGIGTTTPSERFHVVLPTGSAATQTPVATIETSNTTTTANSAPPNLGMLRQLPTFAASTSYAGPGISFGFRTAGTANNFAQLLTTSGATTSRVSFYSRTGMTNANPATGTLAENMYLDGTALNVKNLQGGISSIGVDANGNIIRTFSDGRLKKNVQTLANPLSKIMQLRGVSYNWIDTSKMGGQKEIGFIAQELEKVVPEVVSSGGEYKSVNYPLLTALLTEAMKEQQNEIDELKNEMKEVKEQMKALIKATSQTKE